MGIFSAIGSAISSGISAITSAVGGLGIGKIFSGIASLVPSIFNPVITGIGVASVISKLFKSEPDMEELGLRAAQLYESGLGRENFEDFDSYREALYAQEFDRAELSEDESRNAKSLGASIIANELENKGIMDFEVSTFYIMSKLGLSKDSSVDNMKNISKIIDNYDITNSKIERYKEDEMPLYERENLEEAFGEIYKELNVEKTTEEIKDFIKTL